MRAVEVVTHVIAKKRDERRRVQFAKVGYNIKGTEGSRYRNAA